MWYYEIVKLLSVLLSAWLFALASSGAANLEAYAENIASLIDPAKLATLGERQANPRVQKYVAQLAEAKSAGLSPRRVARRAISLVAMKPEADKLTAAAMVRNLVIAERLGCLDTEGVAAMRKGLAATVRKGPYSRDPLSVDHIIPLSVAPELDRVIANLELLPLRLNEKKRAKIGQRQRSLAEKLHKAGLLSDLGYNAVLETPTTEPRRRGKSAAPHSQRPDLRP